MINITPTAFHCEGRNNFRKKQYLSNERSFFPTFVTVLHLTLECATSKKTRL